MATKKRKQKQTLSEFKAWLDGVVELQDQDWYPNATQWKQIRDRIGGIDDTPIAPTAPAPAMEPLRSTNNVQPASNTIPGIRPAPMVGGIPSGSIMKPTPEGNTDNDDVADMNSASVFI